MSTTQTSPVNIIKFKPPTPAQRAYRSRNAFQLRLLHNGALMGLRQTATSHLNDVKRQFSQVGEVRLMELARKIAATELTPEAASTWVKSNQAIEEIVIKAGELHFKDMSVENFADLSSMVRQTTAFDRACRILGRIASTDIYEYRSEVILRPPQTFAELEVRVEAYLRGEVGIREK